MGLSVHLIQIDHECLCPMHSQQFDPMLTAMPHLKGFWVMEYGDLPRISSKGSHHIMNLRIVWMESFQLMWAQTAIIMLCKYAQRLSRATAFFLMSNLVLRMAVVIDFRSVH